MIFRHSTSRSFNFLVLDYVSVIRCHTTTPTIYLLSFDALWRSFFDLVMVHDFFIVFIIVILIIHYHHHLLFISYKTGQLFSQYCYSYSYITTALSGRILFVRTLTSLHWCHPHFHQAFSLRNRRRLESIYLIPMRVLHSKFWAHFF